MAIKNYKMIICDICGQVDYYETTSNDVARRTGAKCAGWLYTKDKQDICKECMQKVYQRISEKAV